ncbi:MAG: oligosaccharide flippase family protein, partial [Planctomycetes bacterium]|nr:oligosaccharide flippase family protein [Planctomycetota bacterium]
AAMIITALTPSVSIIISLWVVREYISFRPRYFSKVIFQKSLRFGFQVGLATLAAFLVYRIDQGILGYLVSAEQVGIYIVAVGLADRVKMLPHAIATVFLPYLTNDIINRQQQVPQVFRYATIISVGSMVLIGILGAPAVWLFFGREYMNAIAPFLLLLPGIAALGAASVLANDLAAREKPKYSMWISITILVFNIVLNFIFIPWIGISGAALASTLCYLGAIGMWIVVYQHESHTAYRALVPRIDDVGKVFQEIILLIKPQRPI